MFNTSHHVLWGGIVSATSEEEVSACYQQRVGGFIGDGLNLPVLRNLPCNLLAVLCGFVIFHVAHLLICLVQERERAKFKRFERFVVLILYVHLVEEQHHTVVFLHNVDIHRYQLLLVYVVVRVFCVSFVAVGLYEILEGLCANSVHAFLNQRASEDAGGCRILRIVNIEHLFEQGRRRLEDVTFFV